MEKSSFFKKNWLRNTIKGMSLTTMAFAFQACYGTPQDFGYDNYVEGVVFNLSHNRPIKGIKVSANNEVQYTITDEEGKFKMYLPPNEYYSFEFEDVDGEENGSFLTLNDSVPYEAFGKNRQKVKFYMYEKE